MSDEEIEEMFAAIDRVFDDPEVEGVVIAFDDRGELKLTPSN